MSEVDDWAIKFRRHNIGQLRTEAMDMAYKFMAKYPNTWKKKLDSNDRYKAVKLVLAIKEEQEAQMKKKI
jgi:hypothetical protein